ncbi:DNA-binding protein, putative [Pseudooceanicola batsensis HTCC2597]|uniref:DNA-binding protein, putative n=1 Tax=Pseudooceanicola batsensis (strain ATCC BAA-863 / DSM 15984 / KCTC 12145 / HTCC2597) TaxID=252305 RepID=A3TUE5_PSEBH|nr:XRE family transcriptional regulator [Pseudooceanicola batsensis]EAQ04141.1 DNA-binding protein, putative [Pseudooceanicola batsensis HTCC2597]
MPQSTGDKTTAKALTAFGQKVRTLRRGKGLTLQQVADRAGMAGSTISKIENSNLSPTFDGLLKLARGLDVDLSTLLEGEGGATATSPAPSIGRLDVTRAASRGAHDAATYIYEPLAMGLKQKLIDATYVVVKARDVAEFDQLVSHPGEELIYVLSGEVELHSDLYAPIRLGAGDSVYYDAGMGHALISVGDEDATLLNIVAGGAGFTALEG